MHLDVRHVFGLPCLVRSHRLFKASHGNKRFFVFNFGNDFWEMSKSIIKITLSIVSYATFICSVQ
jgi:hypothetical protein